MARWMLVIAVAAVLMAGCSDAGPEPRSLGRGIPVVPDAMAARQVDEAVAIRLVVPDGDELESPVTVSIDLYGLTRGRPGPATDLAVIAFVAVDASCVDAADRYPGGPRYRALGPTFSADLDLDPGPHTLCAQVTDGHLTTLGISDEVRVTVAAPQFQLAPLSG